MAKELPYFKFEPNKYLTGDITLCSFTAQGVFMSLCAHYWSKDCSMSLAIAKQRFSNNEADFQQLIDFGIIKLLEDGNICIDFLDEQMEQFVKLSDIRAKSGRKGGKSKANAKQIKANANIEEERRGEKRKEDNIPVWSEFLAYAQSKKVNVNVVELRLKYDSWVENNWKTGGEKPRDIVNWKTTLLNTLPYIKEQAPKLKVI